MTRGEGEEGSAVPQETTTLVARDTTRRFVARNVDIPWRADNSRSRRELGVTYRPMRESMEQMFQQMIDAGHFRRR